MKIEFNGTPEEVMMEVSDFLEQKAPKQNLTPAAAKAVAEVVIDTVKKEAKAKKEAPAPAPKKEEPKPAEADMKPTPSLAPKKEEPKPAEENKISPADIRTMCAAYCQKVPDGKARIKQWLTDKGYKKVSDIPEADLPEFKALVSL